MAYVVVGNNNYVYSDVPLGVSIEFDDITTFTNTTRKEQLAKSHLINILLTQRGERLHNVNFGSDLLTVIFDPITDDLKLIIDEMINNAVDEHASYIDIDNIEIRSALDDPDLAETIEIIISFIVNDITLPEPEIQDLTITAQSNGILIYQ